MTPAEVVASFFPDIPHELLVRSLRRYLDAGSWARDTAMSKQGFERLGLSFLSGRSLKRSPAFANCVALNLTYPPVAWGHRVKLIRFLLKPYQWQISGRLTSF
jgi:hypothetical protein